MQLLTRSTTGSTGHLSSFPHIYKWFQCGFSTQPVPVTLVDHKLHCTTMDHCNCYPNMIGSLSGTHRLLSNKKFPRHIVDCNKKEYVCTRWIWLTKFQWSRPKRIQFGKIVTEISALFQCNAEFAPWPVRWGERKGLGEI